LLIKVPFALLFSFLEIGLFVVTNLSNKYYSSFSHFPVSTSKESEKQTFFNEVKLLVKGNAVNFVANQVQ